VTPSSFLLFTLFHHLHKIYPTTGYKMIFKAAAVLATTLATSDAIGIYRKRITSALNAANNKRGLDTTTLRGPSNAIVTGDPDSGTGAAVIGYGGWKVGDAAADFDIKSTLASPSNIQPTPDNFGYSAAYGNDLVTGPMAFIGVEATLNTGSVVFYKGLYSSW
jgi:hypothetical protein